jgi:hypothetical protein
MKPSEASTPISSGERPRGLAWPRFSVSQRTPSRMMWTSSSSAVFGLAEAERLDGLAWPPGSAARALPGEADFADEADFVAERAIYSSFAHRFRAIFVGYAA